MEHKSVSFELKSNRGKREIEGYASTYEKDLVNDIIQRGAFKKTIAERLPKNQIKILWQHDSNQPIGKPIHMEEDSKGLFIVGKISDTRLGNDALTLIEDGVVDTMSIGYDVIKDEIAEDKGSRLLKELRLYEFSPVTFPANPTAAITGIRKDLNALLGEFSEEKMYNLVKEGRVLSKANIATIEEAIISLQQVLQIASGGRADGKSLDPVKQPNPFTALLAEMKEYTNNFTN